MLRNCFFLVNFATCENYGENIKLQVSRKVELTSELKIFYDSCQKSDSKVIRKKPEGTTNDLHKFITCFTFYQNFANFS